MSVTERGGPRERERAREGTFSHSHTEDSGCSDYHRKELIITHPGSQRKHIYGGQKVVTGGEILQGEATERMRLRFLYR